MPWPRRHVPAQCLPRCRGARPAAAGAGMTRAAARNPAPSHPRFLSHSTGIWRCTAERRGPPRPSPAAASRRRRGAVRGFQGRRARAAAKRRRSPARRRQTVSAATAARQAWATARFAATSNPAHPSADPPPPSPSDIRVADSRAGT